MITFEDAKKLALSRHEGFDSYAELKDAYVFWDSKEPESIGGLGEAVVMKETGAITDFPSYRLDTKEEYEVLQEGHFRK